MKTLKAVIGWALDHLDFTFSLGGLFAAFPLWLQIGGLNPRPYGLASIVCLTLGSIGVSIWARGRNRRVLLVLSNVAVVLLVGFLLIGFAVRAYYPRDVRGILKETVERRLSGADNETFHILDQKFELRGGGARFTALAIENEVTSELDVFPFSDDQKFKLRMSRAVSLMVARGLVTEKREPETYEGEGGDAGRVVRNDAAYSLTAKGRDFYLSYYWALDRPFLRRFVRDDDSDFLFWFNPRP